MKKIFISLALLLVLIPSCIKREADIAGPDLQPATLVEMLNNLASKGDLSAQAVIKTDMLSLFPKDRSDSNNQLPMAFYMISGGYITRNGKNISPFNPATIEVRNTYINTYIASQGLSEEEFLNHPKLKEFLLLHFIDKEITFNENYDGQTETYLGVSGNEVILSTDFKRSIGGTTILNDIAVSTHCQYQYKDGRLCFIDTAIVSDFDWSQ